MAARIANRLCVLRAGPRGARSGRWVRDALARADAGRQIDELLDEIGDLEREITLSPTVTLQDAAVKLRRLSVYLGPGTREAASGSTGSFRKGGAGCESSRDA